MLDKSTIAIATIEDRELKVPEEYAAYSKAYRKP